MLSVLYIMISLALLAGITLGYSWLQSRVGSASLVKRIDAILPQTQCGQCSYAGCKPYATAIAQGNADINQCPPGGEAGVRALASLLDMPYKPLNIEYGVTKPKSRAWIDEDICIGCTICIQACPVDAILGASKHMHTVIIAECTGCELCVAPCPVDCISMEAIAELPEKSVYPGKFSLFQSWRYAKSKIMPTGAIQAADIARERYEFRLMRLARDKQERAQRRAQKTANAIAGSEAKTGQQEKAEENKKAAIAAAIERVKAQQTILTSHHRPKPPAPLS